MERVSTDRSQQECTRVLRRRIRPWSGGCGEKPAHRRTLSSHLAGFLTRGATASHSTSSGGMLFRPNIVFTTVNSRRKTSGTTSLKHSMVCPFVVAMSTAGNPIPSHHSEKKKEENGHSSASQEHPVPHEEKAEVIVLVGEPVLSPPPGHLHRQRCAVAALCMKRKGGTSKAR